MRRAYIVGTLDTKAAEVGYVGGRNGTARRQGRRLPYAINDPAFADAPAASFRAIPA